MKILLTNDDGFGSPGLEALERSLTDAGHEIWVCAPEAQRSAFSHCISMFSGVHIKQHGERHFSCSGSPADCILMGMRAVMPGLPDLVVSGINHGFNTSSDIIYSGTVAAAREALMHGLPAIAISAGKDFGEEIIDFGPAAGFLAENLEKLFPLCKGSSFLNINVPKEFGPGFKVGRMGMLDYHDRLRRTDSEDGSFHVNLYSGGAPSSDSSDGSTDFELMDSNCISITPLVVLPALDEEKAAILSVMGRS